MSRENVASSKRIYEARNRGDIDAVLAECVPDVTWHSHLATLDGHRFSTPTLEVAQAASILRVAGLEH